MRVKEERHKKSKCNTLQWLKSEKSSSANQKEKNQRRRHQTVLPVFELSWNFPWSLPFTISYLISVFSVLSLVSADKLRTSVPTATSSCTIATYSGARKTGRYSFRSTTETVTVPRAERGSGEPRSVAQTVSSKAECCESFRGFSSRITPVVSSIEKCPLAESERE